MNRLLLTLGLAAMDVCWTYPWLVLLGAWADATRPASLLTPTSILLLVVAGAATTYVLGRRSRYRKSARTVAGLLALVASATVVQIDQQTDVGALVGALASAIGQVSGVVVAFALALYLWWRGTVLGRQAPGFLEVEGAFRWGIGRLVAFGVLLAISSRSSITPAVEARATPFVVGFFFVSLLTLALARLESLRTRSRSLAINAQWLGVLVSVVSMVVLLALVAAQVVSFDILTLAARPVFDLLGQIVLVLVYVIVIPLAYLIQWLIFLMLSMLHASANPVPPQPMQPSDIGNVFERLISALIPASVLVAIKAIGAAIALGLALLIVTRGLSRWRASTADAEATNEQRESVMDAAALRLWLWAWLLKLLRRAARQGPAARAGAGATAESAPPAELDSARAVYVQLLTTGAAAGAARAATVTPHEHLPGLASVLEPRPALEELTEAYVRERYAEMRAPDEELAILRSDLDRVHAKGAVD